MALMMENEPRGTGNTAQTRLDEPGLASHLARLSRDQERRSAEVIIPRVLQVEANADVGGTPPAGTVMLVFERRGEGFLNALEKCLAAQDSNGLKEIYEQRRKEVAERAPMSTEQAIDLLIDLPAYFDFEYGTKLLAVGAGLPTNVGFGTLLFPTNGGDLTDAEFRVRQYTQMQVDTRSDMDYLIVKRAAHLSELERSVLAAVPPDKTYRNITAGGPVHLLPAILLEVAIMTVLGTLCLQLEQEMVSAKLNKEQVDRLGADASARELLAMRREIYERM
ncbi:hypothetical protein [Arthrobacter oryzae]|uniref:hypothetical protein n=1 Tax=Arthrobacter oryzae TaxID=409290 RepID=UPI002857FBD8|nr:hypothetical protein [Arthrobacter oryzae]MDR6507728.1 hypothetical protein [Arthrobacter oryzae]